MIGSTGEGTRAGSRWLTAPAKLTVSLQIVGRQPDGYHELRAEMVALDLADHLRVDPGGEGLAITVDPDLRATTLSAGPENLVNRALAATGRRAAVRLHKRIPVQGGLGGGSADAAAVLRWAGCTDHSVAAGLGSDVPFCLTGGRAVVSGLGEQVSPRPFQPRTFVLLLPPFGVDTAAVYRAWDELDAGRSRPAGTPGPEGSGGHEREVGDEPDGEAPPDGVNDLTAAALAVEPRLGRWRDRLAEITGCRPVLAGSGSTWFVEGDPVAMALPERPWLADGDGPAGRLISARAVPPGWEDVPAGTD